MTAPHSLRAALLAPAAALLAPAALAACSPPASRPPTTSRPPAPSASAPAPAPSAATFGPGRVPPVAPTPGHGGSAGLAATDRLERRHRLAQALPHATAHYRIDFTVAPDGRLAVRVTLLAVLNGPRDLARYEAELARYRAEALAFIAAQGDDPATYTVSFLPPDP